MHDPLHHAQLARPDGRLGHTVIVKETTVSTNDDARLLADNGAKHGVVAIADRQEKGRGRHGRHWHSPAGVNLLFSVVLRDQALHPAAGLLTLAAGVAVARAVNAISDLPARIKWPNDVRVQGRKLCGILAEAGGAGKIEYIVVGIGLNVNVAVEDLPAEIKPLATSLLMETRRTWDRTQVFHAVIAELEAVLAELAAGETEKVIAAWKELDEVIGRRVRAETPSGVFHGQAIGLRPDGALLIQEETKKEERAVVAGDIILMM
jgi:BirA family transcriptional regulator, biotin operon repressor / biotin---[acetyl-CoA-carboxylase] ligase